MVASVLPPKTAPFHGKGHAWTVPKGKLSPSTARRPLVPCLGVRRNALHLIISIAEAAGQGSPC